jgi:hypothetical protein
MKIYYIYSGIEQNQNYLNEWNIVKEAYKN